MSEVRGSTKIIYPEGYPRIVQWVNPADGKTWQIGFPRDEYRKLAMQHAYWKKMESLVIEDMRKKRAEKKLVEIFNGPFIEDTPVPYIGVKFLNLQGRVKMMKSIKFEKWPYGHNIDMRYTPIDMPYEDVRVFTDMQFISNWDDRAWDYENGLEATCNKEILIADKTHPEEWVPHPMCSCGIYSYKPEFTGALIVTMAADGQDAYANTVNVIISLGGYVIPHETGYRSSIAKIEAIVSIMDEWQMPRRLVGTMVDTPFNARPITYPRALSDGYIPVDVKKLARNYNVPMIHPLQVKDFIHDYTRRWESG